MPDFRIMILLVATITLMAGCKPPAEPAADSQTDEQVDEGESREKIRAEVGVGKQGQVIGEKEGFLRTPAKALFTAKQRVVFDIQIPQALRLFEGLNDRLPETHDEFMSEIIEFNRIKLPELPEGQYYQWDAEKGELMVDKPKE